MLFSENKHFYHASIRRYIALFGSLFTNMVIKRKADEGREDIVRVPIKYGNQNVYMSVAQDSSRDHNHISRILPAMAFELTNMYLDVSRKTNPNNQIRSTAASVTGNKKDWQFNRLPYNFLFTLYIKAKNVEDALQIVEQIVPAFDGMLSVTIQDIPDSGVDVDQDIKIKLAEVVMEDNYQDEMKNREVDYRITFELMGYLYKRTQTAYTVRAIDILGAFDIDEPKFELLERVTVPGYSVEDNVAKLHKIVDDGLFDMAPPVEKKTKRK